jgi:hypothetical protein
MDELENKISGTSDLTELKTECADLRRQTTFLLGALVIVSLTLSAVLGLQAVRAKKELDILRPQVAQIVDANKKEEPMIQNFASRLGEFGRSHPDFAPILNKYQIRPNVTNGAGPTAMPVPKK